MATLSIITAAYFPLSRYFEETIASVLVQEVPEGWEIEWVVQEDGVGPGLAARLADLPIVSYQANNAQTGIAATRNQALSRATGELMQNLDHDDVLLPGAVATIIARFSDPRIQWAVGQADDLLPDGERVAYESALPFGVLPAGMVNDWAIEHGGNWPIHCAGLTMRTQLVRAMGGWAGCPVDDDVILFSGISESGDGYNDPATTWLYRKHAQQTSVSEKWSARDKDGRRIALQRIRALRAMRLSFDASQVQALDPTPIHVGDAAKVSAAPGEAWWKKPGEHDG